MFAAAPCEQQRSTFKSRSIQWYDAWSRAEVAPGRVTSPTPAVKPVGSDHWCYRWGPRGCFLAGASRAGDVTSPHPMDSLTIHGAPLSTSRGPGRVREDTTATGDPGVRPRWAEADRTHTGSAGTMTRAAVIAPRPVKEGSCSGGSSRTGALGTAAPKRAAACCGTGRIGLSSSSASRWRCTVCTPSSTAGDGTGVRGHRCAGIETQPKRAPLTRQRTRARIGTAAWRRSGGPSPGCWTSIVAHNCAETVARW